MRALIVYESVSGNTRAVAEAVWTGLARVLDEVVLVPVPDAGDDVVAGCDVLVVGGPTHARGMSRARTRDAAVRQADRAGTVTRVELSLARQGLREWFDTRPTDPPTAAAAFDTRRAGPAWLTGRAAPTIGRRLGRWGCEVVVAPVSFGVGRDDRLLPGETERATAWAADVAAAARSRAPPVESLGVGGPRLGTKDPCGGRDAATMLSWPDDRGGEPSSGGGSAGSSGVGAPVRSDASGGASQPHPAPRTLTPRRGAARRRTATGGHGRPDTRDPPSPVDRPRGAHRVTDEPTVDRA